MRKEYLKIEIEIAFYDELLDVLQTSTLDNFIDDLLFEEDMS